MRVILLGTGGPKPDPQRQGPCLAVEAQGRYLVFDAGRGATTQMAGAGIPLDRLGPLFITHHHFDHIGNLGDVILSGWNLGRKQVLKIYGPKGTKAIVAALLGQVYQKDIEFRMTEADITGVSLAPIDEIVSVHDAVPGLVYKDDVFKVSAQYVLHGHGLGISRDLWKCLGYRVEADGKSIVISGDTVDCDGLDNLAENTDVLVLCCYLSRQELAGMEGSMIAGHILACSAQAGKIAEKAGAGKLVLTHIRQKNPAQIAALVKDIQADFKREVIAGQDLMVIDV